MNDALFLSDDVPVGGNTVMGSRLIPASAYRDAPATVGKVYKELLDVGTPLCVVDHMYLLLDVLTTVVLGL
jgi:hypothetical protein